MQSPRHRSKPPVVPLRPEPFRTVARWRTDTALRILSIDADERVIGISLPPAGTVIRKARKPGALLDAAAHRRALRGRFAAYRVRVGMLRFEAVVFPRIATGTQVVGTRGLLRLLGEGSALRQPGEWREGEGGPARVENPRERSLASAVRSLQLARTLAGIAKLLADARTRKALELQEATQQALLRKEADERRARLLADASAVLDSVTEPGPALTRIGKLLIPRFSDWWVLQLRESGLLRRAALACPDAPLRTLLEQAFPPELSVTSAEVLSLSRPLLYSEAGPIETSELVPPSSPASLLARARISTFLRVPVRLHGRVVGALILGASEPETRFDLADARMAEDLAHRIALAQESARLYREAQREIELRKEAEARLLRFNADLERRVSERTVLLEEATREANSFAYTVAHDLRAPLRAITGFGQVLQEEYSGVLGTVGKDYLARITGSAERMDELIRDLLEYARLNRTDITLGIVDLDELLSRTLQLLAQERQERGAELRWSPPLGRVLGQEVILGQAIRNLLSNAMKFVAPGVQPLVQVRTERRDSIRRILVQDNGIGIDPEHHERVFGMFERLNRLEQYPGTGMGLAIVRRAVERLGGAVGLESRLGEGARFWIDLPDAVPAVALPAPT
ncbi:MAG TPA: ATP-binding protein [Planctomycetota bacterium]|nr:ATP-binding protein [Planctomycetota bacterium]